MFHSIVSGRITSTILKCYNTHTHRELESSPHGIIANMLNSDITVSEFESQ